MTGASSAVIAVAINRVRRRWRAILGIGLVAGALCGLVVASFAGARRTDTAYDRLVTSSEFPDVYVQLLEPRPGLAADIGSTRSVERFVVTSFVVGRHREQRNQVLVPVQSAPIPIADLPIAQGRAADPEAVDEVVVSAGFASVLGLEVDDTFPYQALTDAEFADLLRDRWEGTASGPSVDLRIVGIVRSPTDFVVSGFPTLFATPAYHERYARDARGSSGVWVHLRGNADRSAFAAEIAGLRGPDDPDRMNAIEVTDLGEQRGGLDDAIGVLVAGMLVFGATTAVAGVVVVAQLVSRLNERDASDDRVLGDLGFTALRRRAAVVLPGVVAVAVAMIVSVGTAVVLSRYAPVGVARGIEPSPGVEWNLAFLGAGASAVAVTMILLWVIATRDATRRSPHRALRAGGLGGRLSARVPGPVAAVAGTLAFGGGHRSGARRLAFLGVSAGVGGMVAAALFGGSLDRLASEPSRWGAVGDHVVEVPGPVRERAYAALDDAAEVDSYAEVQGGATTIAGRSVDAYFFEARRGAMTPTVLDGRVPAHPGEIALGPALLDDLGIAIGGLVDVAGEQRAVVGSVLTFSLGDRSDFAEGALVGAPPDDPEFTTAVVRFRPGVDQEQAAARLYGDLEYGPATPPADVANLTALESLPILLALVLGLVGFAATAHSAVWIANRSRKDLAVLRALGLERRQATRIVIAASAMVVATSVAAGGVIGLVLGRTAWAAIAGSIDLATDLRVAPFAYVAPLVIVGAAWALGAVAGRRAVRAPAGVVLRAE